MKLTAVDNESTESLNATPKLELTLWQAHDLHRAMVLAYRRAQSAAEQACAAYEEAINARGDMFIALARIEGHLAELEDRLGFRDIGRTDFVAVDENTDLPPRGA